jgi:hypothetical protein
MSAFIERLNRLEAFSPEEKHLALAFLSGYSPDAFDRAMERVEENRKPPRIPEPEQFGVVVASCPCDEEDRVSWVLISGVWVDRGGDRHGWDSLIDPVLIREGLS